LQCNEPHLSVLRVRDLQEIEAPKGSNMNTPNKTGASTFKCTNLLDQLENNREEDTPSRKMSLV